MTACYESAGSKPALFDSAEALISSGPNAALLCLIDVHLTGMSGIDLQRNFTRKDRTCRSSSSSSSSSSSRATARTPSANGRTRLAAPRSYGSHSAPKRPCLFSHRSLVNLTPDRTCTAPTYSRFPGNARLRFTSTNWPTTPVDIAEERVMCCPWPSIEEDQFCRCSAETATGSSTCKTEHIRSVLASCGWRIRGATGVAVRLGLSPRRSQRGWHGSGSSVNTGGFQRDAHA